MRRTASETCIIVSVFQDVDKCGSSPLPCSALALPGGVQSVHELDYIVRCRLTMRHACPDDLAPFERRRRYPDAASGENLFHDRPRVTKPGRRLDA